MKVTATIEIIEYYDNQDFDTYDISKDTTKEDELFDYVGVLSYLKSNKNSYKDKDKDNFDLSR